MDYREMLLSVWLALSLLIGCSSQKQEDATQKVIDSATGKTQVDTYQQLQKQIKTIRQEETKQFDETTK